MAWGPIPGEIPATTDYDTTSADVVMDKVTGLTWQRSPTAQTYSFQGAYSYCAGLSLGGAGTWRLPTRWELLTIVDSSLFKPAANLAIFPTVLPQRYWTGFGTTNDKTGVASTYVVNFYDGSSEWGGATGANTAICVR
jgi:Protein of unknown function (DUF1566)